MPVWMVAVSTPHCGPRAQSSSRVGERTGNLRRLLHSPIETRSAAATKQIAPPSTSHSDFDITLSDAVAAEALGGSEKQQRQ